MLKNTLKSDADFTPYVKTKFDSHRTSIARPEKGFEHYRDKY